MTNYAKVDIGDLTLYRGDCLRIMPCLPNKSVDCVITDLRKISGKAHDFSRGSMSRYCR